MSATMEITLKTFNHPWLKYLFKKNDNVIKNNKTGETTPADSRICGIRTGTHPGEVRDMMRTSTSHSVS